MKTLEGRSVKYGDNIDTDVIIPARYLAILDREELASHAMEDLDPDFRKKLEPGGVIAESFARIFYRNALNIGLPIVEAPEAAKEIREGDLVSVDFERGNIRDLTTGKDYKVFPFPPFLQRMIEKGGLMAAVNEDLEGT